MPNGMLRHRLDGFIGNYILYYFFLILTPGTVCTFYRVDIVCRVRDGKMYYVKIT